MRKISSKYNAKKCEKYGSSRITETVQNRQKKRSEKRKCLKPLRL